MQYITQEGQMLVVSIFAIQLALTVVIMGLSLISGTICGQEQLNSGFTPQLFFGEKAG